MRVEIALPGLGIEADEETTVSFWHLEEDEEFVEGEDFMEVITNNATYSVPAPYSGKLIKILAQEGDVVKAGDVIGIIETREDDEIEKDD